MIDRQGRVLVVEDDSDVRNVLMVALRRQSLVVDGADGGQQAIELLRANSYSVILLDLLLPDLDGFAVLDAMGAAEDHAAIVLVITGAGRQMVGGIDPRRVHGVLAKPFDAVEVAGIVADCVAIRATRNFDTMALMMMSGPLLVYLAR